MISITFLVAMFNAFLAIVMLINNWKLNKNILSFSLYLLIISFTSVLYDTIINGGSAYMLMLLIGNVGPLFFLVGPLFYFFIRGLVDEHFKFSDKDLIHLIPFFLTMIIMLPYLFKPVEVKLELAANSLQNLTYYMNTTLVFVPTWLNTLLRIVFMTFYILWSAVILRKAYRERINDLKGAVRNQFIANYRWLNLITFASLFLVFLHLGLTMYFRFDPGMDCISKMEDDNMFLVSVIFNALFPLIVLFNPGILFGLPNNKMLNPIIKSQPMDVDGDYNYSVLEAADKAKTYNDYFDALAENLMGFVQQNKPYLDHDFNSEKLSKIMQVPLHHIHFCVKYYFGKTCKKMIAELRVGHAIELIKSTPKRDNETIQNIVYESGFNTYKAFLRTFKKCQGVKFPQWLAENT